MASTAGRYGLSDPFNAAAAINAQAHLMHDLMGQFGSVHLALAAYNAGAGAGYSSGLAAAFTVRLVR